MPLNAGERRDLDAYAAAIGASAVQCRISKRHDFADVLDYDGVSPLVDIRRESGAWVVDTYCKRGCGVKQTQIIDRVSGTLAERSRTNYSDAQQYLRPSGHSGYSGIGPAGIGYLRRQRIETALHRAKTIAEARNAARRTKKES